VEKEIKVMDIKDLRLEQWRFLGVSLYVKSGSM
jgi:hypothetical protein